MSEWVATKDHLPEVTGVYFVIEKRYDYGNGMNPVLSEYDLPAVAFYFQYAKAWEIQGRVPSECAPDYWMEIPPIK